jgi:hypothetical protein
MAVTRYQFRLSTYLATVVIAALVAASPRIVSWAVSGRPPEYVYVKLDGKMQASHGFIARRYNDPTRRT